MKTTRLILSPPVAAGALLIATAGWLLWAAKVETGANRAAMEQWRKEKRTIDLHMHIDGTPERFDRAVRIMDRSGVGIGVNLSGGVVTHKDGEKSPFENVKALADGRYPGRFIHYMNLDYEGWEEPGFSEKAVAQIVEGHRLGAAGFKEYKRLGLFMRDSKGELYRIDDPRLDAMWDKCGELGMPVSIHVADPRAFWLPFDENNERWKELKDHRNWWFGDPKKFPSREDLLAALDRVVERHPKTTFVCVHFANNSEDIDWVDRTLDKRPNMMADLAARIPEIGRHDPEKVRRLFTKHQDRILFATDFMVYERLILGSAGDAERPTDDDGVVFFEKCWRWMETNDRDWAHMTPIQGDWTINSIGLPADVCRKIYFDNANKLLARSMPLPVLKASYTENVHMSLTPDFATGDWSRAAPVRVEYSSNDAVAHPAVSTTVRALWSLQDLYLGYECLFTTLTTFGKPQQEERIGLWDRDVVEAFIGSDLSVPGKYTEYEWAPNGEQLDLSIAPDKKDFAWSSGMKSEVAVDETAKVWRVVVRIPLKSLAISTPVAPPGLQNNTRWRINLYRHDAASKTGLAFSPTLTGTFHTPERFGWLEFQK